MAVIPRRSRRRFLGAAVSFFVSALASACGLKRDPERRIKAGARVCVRLTMVADNRRYHVALVDPLPAGLEIVNPALAVAGDLPQDPNAPEYRHGWWWGPWYEHQIMRDERAEAFASLLWEGV